jgi:hypothetical protein
MGTQENVVAYGGFFVGVTVVLTLRICQSMTATTTGGGSSE